MPRVNVPELGQSALAAFRFDLPLGGRQVTAADGASIAVATLVRHASMASSSSRRVWLLRRATQIARESIAPEIVRDGVELDDENRPTEHSLLRLLAAHSMARGEVHLGGHIVESLLAVAPPDSLAAGRLLLQRGAVALRNGDLPFSQLQYGAAARLGRRLRERELIARGMIGAAGNAFAAGEIQRALRLAELGLKHGKGLIGCEVAALTSMAMSMGMLERYDDALSAFWAAYRLAGSNRRRQSMALSAFGQLLLDAGYPRAARAAFSSGIARATEIFPRAGALGGYAIASAVLEDIAGVEFAVAQTSALARLRGAPWEIVSTMLECSDALDIIAKRSAAATLRRRALRLAQRQGYHQLVYLAENSKRRGLAARFQRPITPGSREIVHLVETMEPPGLPMLVNGR